jgi:GcrA cell cycle regulator
MMAMIVWTDERVEQLKKLWNDGLSASQIAAQLGGVTRNAVIGKVHRLGLSGRTKTVTTTPRASRPKMRPNNHHGRPSIQPLVFGANALKRELLPAENQERAPAIAIPFPAPSPEGRVGILQLSERTCRWPEGDPASSDFKFCGAQTASALPYCPYHCAIAYQPSQDRRRDKRAAGAR